MWISLKGIGSDARIGPSFLFPGPGYGGSCFPKDVEALVRTAGEAGSPLSVLEAVEDANDRQKHRLFEKLQCALGDAISGAHIAVWGLAFAADRRHAEAPALTLVDDVLAAGATITAHDPAALNEAKRRLGDRIGLAESNYDALTAADALVVVTDWNEYRHPDFARIKAALRRPIIVDGRNLYDVTKMQSLGFTYFSFGRGRERS
jgi:UDPglucose 6-dehydrogenase